ncbi:MAG: metallopeptidase TldD-related protein [Methanolinea sp.]|nr:metallopeptidase TldD-related protein [Methanolinea sp.]
MEIIEDILKAGEERADEVEVFLSTGKTVSARLKKEEISCAAGLEHRVLSVRVISGGRIGASSTGNPDRWEECLEAALKSSALAAPLQWGGLPGPLQTREGSLNYDGSLVPEPGRVRALIAGMVEGASGYPVEIVSGSAQVSQYQTILANSRGLYCEERESAVSAGLEAIREQSTGYEYVASWKMDFDPVSVGERAAYLAATSHGGRDIPTGNYDVVLSPDAFGQLLGNVFLPALSGRNVHTGRSRLAGHLGEEVCDRSLSLSDDPFHPRGLGSCLWDAEGTPTRRLPLIEGGILRSFAYDLKTAYQFGAATTGSAVRSGPGGVTVGFHCVTVDGPRRDILERDALWVHDVVGGHTANPLTGDFSVELANAYYTRGGVHEFSVRKAMLAGNVFEMLRETGGLSVEEKVVGCCVLPSIRLKNQRIIGNGE